MKLYDAVHALIQKGAIVSAYALDGKGLAAALAKMAFGNKLGVTVDTDVTTDTLFARALVISWQKFRQARLQKFTRHCRMQVYLQT